MTRSLWLGLLAGLLFPGGARVWEEEQAIAFILAWHPVVAAQRTVAASYQPPSLTRRLIEHTAFYVRAARACPAPSRRVATPPRPRR